MNYLAQAQNIGKPLTGIGCLGLVNCTDPLSVFNRIISTTVGLMTAIGAIWFLFILITGAYGIMSSGGDKGANEQARKKIQTGLTGLIVVIAAVFIIDLIGWLLGFNLILNPGNIIESIRI